MALWWCFFLGNWSLVDWIEESLIILILSNFRSSYFTKGSPFVVLNFKVSFDKKQLHIFLRLFINEIWITLCLKILFSTLHQSHCFREGLWFQTINEASYLKLLCKYLFTEIYAIVKIRTILSIQRKKGFQYAKEFFCFFVQ